MSKTPVTRVASSDALLCEYSDTHVWYETWMFFQAAALLSTSALRSQNEALALFMRNVMVEAFGFHLRNLLDFFDSGDKPKPDDVLAADFFAGGRLPRQFPKLSKAARNARVRANKELAHLTTRRKNDSDPTKPWPVKELTAEMAHLIRQFIKEASPSKLGNDYVARVKGFLA